MTQLKALITPTGKMLITTQGTNYSSGGMLQITLSTLITPME